MAMVTQVIGDNVARAFSLVGALSIVRFRTVVRDTQDTAYVIAAVAVGMAVGAGHFWVAAAGIAIVAVAAFGTRNDQPPETAADMPFTLNVRLALGLDEARAGRPGARAVRHAFARDRRGHGAAGRVHRRVVSPRAQGPASGAGDGDGDQPSRGRAVGRAQPLG